MFSTYTRWPFISRVRFLNVSVSFGQGKVYVCGENTISPPCTPPVRRSLHLTTLKDSNNATIMTTFEDCVFQRICSNAINGSAIASSDSDYCNNNNVPIETCSGTTDGIVQQGEKANANDCDKQQQIQDAYEAAVHALNCLQSNAESLRSSLSEQNRMNSLEETIKYLLRSGLSIKDLESMSFIHVAGTKGKGSTCALTESILRSYGVHTGFFSSPHLVSLTERIRLNGQPISKSKLIQYFWPVYNALKSQQEYENDMPAYFKFLTILCLHVYLQEKVDVVILEVGIGGELDCTNIVPNTKTVGISSLGLEHTQILGHTLKEIAWQKAGIIKSNSRVYTSVQQAECLEVIEERTKEKNATLYQVPKMDLYFTKETEYLKGRLNNVTMLNGSLAVQLAYDWLRQNRNGFYKDYEINKPFLAEKTIQGLLNCSWPGRCQVVKFLNLNMHLDGAHTLESMQVCGEWFAKVSSCNKNPKMLIFNTTGDRDSIKLLTTLRSFAHFDLVCFVPNVASSSASSSSDTKSVLYAQVEQLKRAAMHATNWKELCREQGETNTGMAFPTILAAFQHIRCVYKDNKRELDVLVTGSIHLIGATILSLNELGKNLQYKRRKGVTSK